MASEADEAEGERPSRSQLKREMLWLQELGAKLAALSEEELQVLSLPENLLDAIREYKRTPTHGGRRRQMQYIGKLMRGFDVESARAAVETLERRRAAEAQVLHEAERWRTRLIASDEALTEWVAKHPDSDARKLSNLIRAARDAPTDAASRRALRELFRFIRATT